MRLSLCAILMAASSSAQDAQLAVAPADSLFAVQANGRGYTDIMVPSVFIRAGDGEQFDRAEIQIKALRGSQVIETQEFNWSDIQNDTHGLAEAGIAGFVNSQALDPNGLEGVFGAPTRLGTAPSLRAGEAVGIFERDFIVRGAIDAVKVTAVAHQANGADVVLEKTIPVVQYRSTIEYHAPVRGYWMMTGIPTMRSHHRFNPPSEFALDFFKVDAEGHIWHDDPQKAEDFYGYGAAVDAAADGVVVDVIDGEHQDRAALIRQPNETPQAAGQRIQAFNAQRYARDFRRAAAGNMVVLKHESGSVTEYSAYGHLKAGIPVKVGELVKQGQAIGFVGDTGDSAAAHLHFQINAGPDPFTSRSLPVNLKDIKASAGLDDLAELITTP